MREMAKVCRLQLRPKIITEASPFGKEKLEHLYRLFNQSLPSCSPTQTGKSLSALSVHSKNFTPWIIDYGASGHMTSLSNLFLTYSPCPITTKLKLQMDHFIRCKEGFSPYLKNFDFRIHSSCP